MTLTNSLLAVAVLTGVLPLASIGFRPPESIRDLEKTFVVAVVTLGIGAVAVSLIHSLRLFGVAHLLYLLIVVTVPVLLGGWFVCSIVRRRRTLLLRLGGIAALLIALAGVWGTHIEPNWLRTDVVALAAPVQQELTIGVLSDLQTSNVGKHEWNAVDTLLAEAPDMVLVPGDFFQGPPDQIAAATPDFIALLSALVDEVEVVAVVTGDSDWVGQLKPMVETAGALFIDNTTTELVVAGQPIRLAGVTVRANPERLATIAELTKPSDALTILLAHRPDVVFDLPLTSDVDLIVSGHTHGGQVALPLIGPPVTLSEVPRSVASGGLGLVDQFPVYVSTGVGLERGAAPQVRFGVRPSVGIISVVPA